MNKLFVWAFLAMSIQSLNAQFLNSKKVQTFEGYFKFYYEEATDKIYLEVKNLDQDFLYVNSLATGIGSNDIGLDRGQLGNTRVVKFQKAGNKLLLVQPNLDYRANTKNQLERKSIEQAFAKSVLFGFKILEEKEQTYLIDLTPFLMLDAHGVSSRLKGEGSYKIDESKSALSLERTKAFPKNVEFEALLTFKGEATGRNIKSVTPTPELVSVIQHHSFIELPDDKYQPREFDVRSGSFSISYMDYATPVQEPIKKRLITRHRLEKKNPVAAISEAVEPIIYYLDPGTPEPVRSALLEGASWWNEAFESIGFKDAFQVKLLPEDADPMDCRYNVIQWVHRSTRGWSYGASVTDPRTGEIIKGHVSLGSLRIRQDFLIAQALMNKPFAERDDNYQSMLEMALARIRQLSAHEVGHTLGFAHNFAASVNNRASVMDYPHPLVEFKNNQIDFSNAYATGIAPWDKVTVAYSYTQFNENDNEKEALNRLLENAYNSGIRFISDYDARATGGAHPLAHLWDNGTDAAKELERVLEVRQQAIVNFSKDNIRSSEPFSVLEDVFVPLYFFHRYQTEAAAKIIGGLDYNYAVKGDNQFTVKTVNATTQKIALNTYLKTVNAGILAIPEDRLTLFPPRAYSYNRDRESFKGKTGVGFDPMSAAITAADMSLGLLLHPQRTNRVFQQHSLDENQLSLETMLNELIDATFGKTFENTYHNDIQQLINERVLLHLINLAIDDSALFQVKYHANKAIGKISKDYVNHKRRGSVYAAQFSKIISEYYENPDKFKLKKVDEIPDGAPIGSYFCTTILEE
ncbi:zinc-dependent metalloprotease [Paucihalobacter ruber]|uniref:Zinc-dependent metalloprotease n=1 Tax=Paucihalobacter ruber TaxID=2567861 RepID=A0A506PFS1_9FLAO|nr:zinc-dependent metalloprotease [Paucihalobacter ruber]TPV32424.1 zinc-dependent metalloprotease [Paucihalobacter ruber]